MYPLMDPKHFLGGILDPDRGPHRSLGRHACLRQVRAAGRRRDRAPDARHRHEAAHRWHVGRDHQQGNVHAEHVVNAGGLWAREVGRMVGLELPVLAMEHQYLITEDLPEFRGQPELLHCIDFEGELYLRQERGGMLLGTYERAGVPWSPQRHALGLWAGSAAERSGADRAKPRGGLPALPATGRGWGASGGQRSVHFCTGRQSAGRPDRRPAQLLGGLRRHGRIQPRRRSRAVIGQLDGGGRSRGRHLGHGRGPLRGLGEPHYTNAKVRENYSRRFRIRFPNEELEAARPLRTSPIYDRLQAENAVFGEYCGLEHALWFAPKGSEAREQVTFRRSNAHDHVAAECRAVRENVGLIETTNYGKFEVTGQGRGRLALARHGQQGALGWTHRACADAQ